MLRAHVSTFWVQKDGASPREYEDASWPPEGDVEVRGSDLTVAVTDGATESLLAGRWARLLACTAATHLRESVAKRIGVATSLWTEELTRYVSDRESSGRPIQWYEEPGLERGAQATILVGTFRTSKRTRHTGSYSFVAVGDTNLFVVRKSKAVRAFPLEKASEFGTTPALVSSKKENLARSLGHMQHTRGKWQAGDDFILATDALACWILREIESGGVPWATIGDMGTAAVPPFPDWIASLRRRGQIRNDDTTLMRVQVIA